MRFVKILLVCVGLVLLSGLGTNHGSAAVRAANPAFVADGGEPFPPHPPPGSVVPDGREPFPPTPPHAPLGPRAAPQASFTATTGRLAASFPLSRSCARVLLCPSTSSA